MPKDLIVSEIIEQKIYLIRGQKVMLDSDFRKIIRRWHKSFKSSGQKK